MFLAVIGFLVFFYLKLNNIASAATTLEGDVFYNSYDNVGGSDKSNVKVSKNSVLVTNDQNVQLQSEGSVWKLPSYSLSGSSKLSWSNIQSQMSKNTTRLEKERAKTTLAGGTLLLGNVNINQENNPDGQVWVINGDLNVGNDSQGVEVRGKGTYIVKGNLNINNNLSYQTGTNSSIGFIVSGNINIKSKVTNLVGAYYTEQKDINFE